MNLTSLLPNLLYESISTVKNNKFVQRFTAIKNDYYSRRLRLGRRIYSMLVKSLGYPSCLLIKPLKNLTK